MSSVTGSAVLFAVMIVLQCQVHFHNGGSTNLQDYELCLRADDISLPATGYFGISAATGGLAGNYCYTSHYNIIEASQLVCHHASF